MVVHMEAREARDNFTHLVNNVHDGNRVVIVDRLGQPMVAIIPVVMYERLVAERDARFQVLDRVRNRLPDVSAEEVEQDVTEAITAVRAADAAGGS